MMEMTVACTCTPESIHALFYTAFFIDPFPLPPDLQKTHIYCKGQYIISQQVFHGHLSEEERLRACQSWSELVMSKFG